MATKPKTQIMSHDDTVMSPITKASNVLFEDGKTAQDKLEDNVEKSFTPSVENSSSMFKVGQGDNVDYSGNVVDGAYDSCVLKGRSLVNCIQEPSSQDVVLPYEFTEGQYVTINETKESGALGVELKGQTLVNLAKVRSKQASNAVGEVNIPIKPNTKYIAFANVTYEDISNLAMFLVSPIYVESASGLNGDSLYTATVSGKGGTEIRWNQTGVRYVTFTSTSNQCYLHIRTGGSTSNLKYNNMQVFEYQDNMENWDIPYFEGMTSCKMPILSTVGKNLFNIKDNTHALTKLENGNYKSIPFKVLNLPKFKEKTSYTLSFSVSEFYDSTYQFPQITYTDGTKLVSYRANKTFNGNPAYILTSDSTKTISCIDFSYGTNDVILEFVHFQIEEGSNSTSYEPYKSSILSLPEEVVLRSLPNGVCDTFNTRTGVYTQRIGDDTFIGASNENWRTPNNYTTGDTMPFRITKPTMQGNGRVVPLDIICDKMKIETPRNAWGNDGYDGEGLSHGTGKGEGVDVRILKSKLPTEDVAGFKQWLSQNPIRVQYQLHTPIITKVNLSSTLKSWNTTTHIYSEIPENTLYPILSHSNPSYPVILKPSTKYSIVANSYSNDHTNSAINFNLGGATASTVVGNRVTTITTPSALSNNLLTMSGRGNKLNHVMVIEGDVVGDEPYFEGICDVKSPVVKNAGKNLFNLPLMQKQSYVKEFSEHSITVNNGLRNISKLFELEHKANEQYTIVYDREAISGKGVSLFAFRYTDGTLSYAHPIAINTSLPNKTIDRIELTFSDAGVSKLSNICLVKDEVSNLTYEPYKSNTTIFNQEDGQTIVLRSLPNGVCDTLNVETGEYVRRIGEVVLSGTENENWNNFRIDSMIKHSQFYFRIEDKLHYSQVICDNFISIPRQISDTGGECISGDGGNGKVIWINILNSRLPSLDVNGFKSWLSQNPITVQYELATPVVSTIDVQGFPYAYKDGHVQLSSGYNGQSLTPKIEYSLPINRNGQIRMNQAMVERHQKHIDKLQAIIITNMVNTQYRQSLTKINYQLGGEQV